jgi:hypothetical protein
MYFGLSFQFTIIPFKFQSFGFVQIMTWVVMWEVQSINMQSIDQRFFLFGLSKKGSIFHKMRLSFSTKQALYSTNDNLSFLEIFSMGKLTLLQ